MLRHSVEAFSAHPAITDIVVVIGTGHIEFARTALRDIDRISYVFGGVERRDSVNNALQHLQAKGFSGNIMIHDAARPFLAGIAA